MLLSTVFKQRSGGREEKKGQLTRSLSKSLKGKEVISSNIVAGEQRCVPTRNKEVSYRWVSKNHFTLLNSLVVEGEPIFSKDPGLSTSCESERRGRGGSLIFGYSPGLGKVKMLIGKGLEERSSVITSGMR